MTKEKCCIFQPHSLTSSRILPNTFTLRPTLVEKTSFIGSRRGDTRPSRSTKEANTDCRLEGKEDKTIPLGGSSTRVVAATTTNPTVPSSSSTTTPDSIPNSFRPFDGRIDFRSWLRRFRFHTNEVPQDQRSRLVFKYLGDDQLDKALDVGLSVSTPFDALCDQLQRLFQPQLAIEDAIHRLIHRRRRFRETPEHFAADLSRLASDAYSSLAAADKDQLALYHFQCGLDSDEVAYSLRLNPSGDLESAIQRATRLLEPDPPGSDYRRPSGSTPFSPGYRRPGQGPRSRGFSRADNNTTLQSRKGLWNRPPYSTPAHRLDEADSGTRSVPICSSTSPDTLPFFTLVHFDNRPVRALVDAGATWLGRYSLRKSQEVPCSLQNLNVYRPAQSMDMPEKVELQRKLELLRKIYEEGRLENLRHICEKYRNAGVAAMNELLELTGDPKLSPFEVMRAAGFDPQVLGFDPDT
ncbi:hypothetical protein SprV_0200845700 [Sparganum proliferum]